MTEFSYLCLDCKSIMDSFPDTLLKSRYAAEKKSILALCEKGDTFSLADLARRDTYSMEAAEALSEISSNVLRK